MTPTELLRKVQHHILEEPKRANIREWVYPSDKAPCGTEACISGWVCILVDGRYEWPACQYGFGARRRAAELLHLDLDSMTCFDLFKAPGIKSEPGTPEHAQEMSDRIERFINKTGEFALT